MHKLIIILVLLFPSFLLTAQDKPEAETQDPLAEPWLEKLAVQFTGNQAIQIEFKYEVLSLIDKSSVSDFGSVILKGNKYKLKTDDAIVMFNGTKLWSYNTATEEVYLSTPSGEEMDQLLADPFRMISQYKKLFKYRYKGEIRLGGRILQEIDLYPKEINGNYSILRVWYDPSVNKPYSILLKQKNGYDLTIFINEIIPNLKISETAFEWSESEFPNAILIEL